MLKEYLPLKQDGFYYDNIFENPNDIFQSVYGEDDDFNLIKSRKEWYSFVAFGVRDIALKPIIPKLKALNLALAMMMRYGS